MIKQHITTEQLGELSQKSREKLMGWLYKDLRNIAIGQDPDESTARCLSIGQMLAFLDEHRPQTLDIPNLLTVLDITIEDVLSSRIILCDKLWEAVKEALYD